jgi:hypothetical protein
VTTQYLVVSEQDPIYLTDVAVGPQGPAGTAQTAAAGLVATGVNSATALALTAGYNVVATTPTNSGVKLPNVIGAPVWVYNAGANTLLVYPPSGTIDGLSSRTLAAGSRASFVQITSGVWYLV